MDSGHYPLARGRAWLGGRSAAAGALVALVFAGSLVACPAADRSGTDPSTAVAAPDANGQTRPATANPGTASSTARPGEPARDASPRPRADARPAIVFLGTSLTAGYGLPESEAYPALIEQRLAAAGFDYRVVNAGVSGDTSAGGLRRLDWLLRLPVAVLVVELGANDMLRGQPVEALEANLVAILEKTRAAHPGVRFVIEGMRAAPNLGREYGAAFDAVYPRIAERFQTAFVPFLLEDVAARRALNQADGIHPTAEGHALIAERVWRTLEPVVREVGAQR